MAAAPLILQPGKLTHQQLSGVFDSPVEVQLNDACWTDVRRSHDVVLSLLKARGVALPTSSP